MGLYSYWKLNETSGIVVSDSSGNGRGGTTVNTPTWVAGKLNNCLQFNGTNQYATFGQICNWERTQPFSVLAWINTTHTDPSLADTIFSKIQVTSNRGLLCDMLTGKLRLIMVSVYSSNSMSMITTSAFNNGAWRLVVFTYNGSSLNTGLNIWVDNVLQAGTRAGTLTATILNTGRTLVGNRDDIASNFYKGKIDNVEVYDYVLSADEISSRWNGGAGREQPAASGNNQTIMIG